METRIRATYNRGVFVPLPGQISAELAEDTEVELTVHALEAEIADAEARATLMRDIADSMKANSFAGNPARFTREELHAPLF